jgi:2,3-bisphosphoglycerate-independent phosphoglycerate mutase
MRPQIDFYSMVKYDEKLTKNILFTSTTTEHRLSQLISESGKKQLKLAETEKYAHVTYFFNGGEEKPFPNEDQALIPSKNAVSYADVPEMSSWEITAKLEESLEQEKYDFILVNYASPDMVGHTGDFVAAEKAVKIVDQCLASLIPNVLRHHGCLIITADHGNVEKMIDFKTGEVDTQHSNNPVPCWIVTPDNHLPIGSPLNKFEETVGILADVMPTVLDFLEIPKPKDLIGKNLLEILKIENRLAKKKE